MGGGRYEDWSPDLIFSIFSSRLRPSIVALHYFSLLDAFVSSCYPQLQESTHPKAASGPKIFNLHLFSSGNYALVIRQCLCVAPSTKYVTLWRAKLVQE